MNVQQKLLPICRQDHLPAALNKGRGSLNRLASRIIEIVESIVWWEQQLFTHPDHFEKDGLCSFSTNELRQKIVENKQIVIKCYEQFSKLLTSQGEKVKSISFADKKDLEHLLTAISSTEIQEWLDQASAVCLVVKKILYSLIQKKDKQSPCENLKPSAFFQDRKDNWSHSFFYRKNPDVSLTEHQVLKDRVNLFLNNGDKNVLLPIQEGIFRILEGTYSLNELPLTKENFRQYLTHVKIIDQAIGEYNRSSSNKSSNSKMHYKNSTYELRSLILRLGSPSMTTCEAYTKTLDPKKFNDRIYLRHPMHWMPERTGLHAKLFANQLILAAALSQCLNRYSPSIIAFGGNTASGKSYDGEVTGDLNADTFKYYLKIKNPINKEALLINSQVHKEGTAIFDSFRKGIQEEACNGTIVIQGRFSTVEEIEDSILKPANWNKKDVILQYYLVPLETSLIRVPVRDPYGKNPCPPLWDIIKGYKDSILCSKEIIRQEAERKSSTIKFFKLYNINFFKLFNTDSAGVRCIVAEKRDNVLTVFSQAQLDACTQLPLEKDIESQSIRSSPENLLTEPFS